MNIIQPWLYISNYRTSMSAAFIQKYQITHLLHLAENVQHPQVNTLYLPVEDGVPTPTQDIQRGVDFILKNYQHKLIDIVHRSGNQI